MYSPSLSGACDPEDGASSLPVAPERGPSPGAGGGSSTSNVSPTPPSSTDSSSDTPPGASSPSNTSSSLGGGGSPDVADAGTAMPIAKTKNAPITHKDYL